jgi:acyl-coenzyme A synthetase/AMP-(fatty) acid ligase
MVVKLRFGCASVPTALRYVQSLELHVSHSREASHRDCSGVGRATLTTVVTRGKRTSTRGPIVVSMPKAVERYGSDVEQFYEAGSWTTETLGALVDERARELGDREFATDATTSVSFNDLRDRSIRMAVGLRRVGIDAGDRVAVQLPNWTEFVVVVAAVSRCGAIVVPIMPIYRHDEVSYILDDSEAKAVITCEEFNGFDFVTMYRGLAARHEGLERVFVARSSMVGDVVVGDVVALMSSLAVDGDLDGLSAELGDAGSPDDPHLIVYTSGTTSRPKGCVHTFNTLGFSVRTMADGLGFTSEDVAFGPSPITHATGYMTSVLIPLFAGSATHLMEAWDPVDALARIAKHRCTVSVTATVFLKMLVDAHDSDLHTADSLRAWVCAGSPIPPAEIQAANQAFPSLEVLSLYGRSENMLTTMCSVGDDPQLSLTSDGRAPDGVEVQIVGEAREALAVGQEGDIAYRGPGHMLAYLGQPELTMAMFTPGGFSRSGDLGTMNEDGYVRVTGRTKDIIIRGGMNISAREIEELLLVHPDVKDAALIAVPDDRLGERAAVCIVAVDGVSPTLDSLTTYLSETHQLAKQKLPEYLFLVDALPMTATGKVQKHVLRESVLDNPD